MHLMPGLLATVTLMLAAAPGAVAQAPAAPGLQSPQVRFKVSVTADEQIVAAVHDFMLLVAARNEARNRLSVASPSPELELVLLVERHVQMPRYTSDIGVVMLRLDQAVDTATVEYCLARCDSRTPRLARYVTSTTKFVQALEKATRKLARYRAR
ncbi:MAG: hypothetical protein NUW22_11805 [Acidobacteria bacterium]|nr:hypothetical protein [Acidobacteriota bacterium]